MGNRISYLLKNISIFAVGEMGTKIINFLLVPFYTYVLTTEEYGTADMIFTVGMMLSPIVMISIGEAVMRYALDEDADHHKIFGIAVSAILFGVVVSLLLIPIFSSVSMLAPYRFYVYFYVVLCATNTVLTSFLRGLEKIKLYVSCYILRTLMIGALNIFFLVFLKKGIRGYLGAYILAEAIAALFAFFAGRMYRYCSHWKYDSVLTRKMILFALAVVPNTILWWLINSSDRIMVTAMIGASENGLLAVAYKLPSLLTMANVILMQAWKYSAIKEENSADQSEFSNKMLDSYLKGMFIVSGALILMLKPLTMLLFESSYYESWRAGTYLAVGFVAMGLSNFVGTVYYVKKNMVGNMLSALTGAVVNIALNFLLIPRMGASGATLAACAAYFAILLYCYFDTRKIQDLHIFRVPYMVSFALLFGMCLFDRMPGIWGAALLLLGYAVLMYINHTVITEILHRLIAACKKGESAGSANN